MGDKPKKDKDRVRAEMNRYKKKFKAYLEEW